MKSRWAPFNQEGATLIELLITLVILGIAFLVILGGMTNAIVLSDLHRRQSRAETLLREFAETVKASPYGECADISTYNSIYASPDPDFDPSVTQVRHWSGSDFVAMGSAPGCPGGPDSGIQLVGLKIELLPDRGAEEVSVVKRRPS